MLFVEHKWLRLGLGLMVQSGLVGCVAGSAVPNSLFQIEAQGAGLQVLVRLSGYGVQYLTPTSWDLVRGELSHSDAAMLASTVVVDAIPSGASAVLKFPPVKPGSRYALKISLLKRQTDGQWHEVAFLAKDEIEIDESGATLELSGRFDSTLSPSLPLARATSNYVDSIPSTGVVGRFLSPQDAVAAPDGTIYVADKTRIRRIVRTSTGEVSVTTLAGDIGPGHADGLGDVARFVSISGLAIDSEGGLYVLDGLGNRLRRVDIDAKGRARVSTVAGDGQAGYSDGPGLQARFNQPEGIAVDRSGNLYVADKANHRIRKVTFDESGASTVSTVAGDGQSGNLDGEAATARFNNPVSVAVDGTGNLFIADMTNHRIRQIRTLETGHIAVTTVAGTSAGYLDGTAMTARFTLPTGVAVLGDGSLAVADGSRRIRRVNFNASAPAHVSTLAGTGASGRVDGPGPSASFRQPVSVSVEPTGGLLIAEGTGQSVRRLTLDATGSSAVVTVAGDGVSGFSDGLAAPQSFVQPGGIAVNPAGVVYVADAGTNRVLKADPSRTGDAMVKPIAGTGVPGYVDGDGLTAQFSKLAGMTCDRLGTLYVIDGNRVRRIVFDGERTTVSTVAGDGLYGYADGSGAQARFSMPTGIASDSQGALYVTETSRIRKIAMDSTGAATVSTFAGSVDGGGIYQDGPALSAGFYGAGGIAINPRGDIYVAEYLGNRIRKISVSEQMEWVVTTLAGSSRGVRGFVDGPGSMAVFDVPMHLAVDGDGAVIVADSENHRIRKVLTDAYGNITVSTLAGSSSGFSDGPAATAKFSAPLGVTVDRAGFIFVADTGNGLLRRIVP